MSVIEFIGTFDAWILAEFMFSFIMPFVVAHGFYLQHGMQKKHWDMFCRESMRVGLVAGLTSFFIFCVLQIYYNFYSEESGVGDLVSGYILATILYFGVGYFVGFIFVIFGKRRKQ